MNAILKPACVWTNDCQGKKDYDGPLLDISCRYWPSGGGFHISHGHGDFNLSNDPNIKPSAAASVLLRYGDPDENDTHGENSDYITLARQEFEADQEWEVREQVEKWVAEKHAEISQLLLKHFNGGVTV